MSDYQSLNHTKWDCKYHIVFIPKCRRKVLYGKLRRELGPVFRELAKQRESEIVEGHLLRHHVHMMIRIPPKFSVSAVMGYIKGKSAIRMARDFMGRHQSFKGYHFWARGYFVSTVGIDEEIIRKYIREQEKNDKRLDQKKLF